MFRQASKNIAGQTVRADGIAQTALIEALQPLHGPRQACRSNGDAQIVLPHAGELLVR